MPRFPFPIPTGWFQVAFEDDLAPGELTTLRFFDRELVLWRDGGGDFHVHDAYCPHLGAHLGKGGRIEGDRIRCPFHAWAFAGDGRCVEIPYAERIPPGARLDSWPTTRIGAFVMAWYHPDGEPPSFDLPEVPELSDPTFGALEKRAWTVKSIPQEMGENAFDPAHFETVHGHPRIGETEEIRFEGPVSTMLSKQVFPSSKGPVDARIDVVQHGPGFALTRYQGLVDALLVGTPTPLDRETTLSRFTFSCRNPEGDPQTARIAEAFVAEVSRQIEQDIPIWENKVYRERPLTVESERGIAGFRRWYRQFYVDPAREPRASD